MENAVSHNKARFASLAKGGLFGTLTQQQVWTLLIAVIVIVGTLFIGGLGLTLIFSPLWGALLALGAVTVRTEPLVQRLLVGVGFFKKKQTKQNVAILPAVYGNVKVIADENENQDSIVIVDNFGLPGRLGSIMLVEATPSGAFVMDKTARTYSFSVRLHSKSWVLSDVEEQIQVREKFESFLSSLPHKPDLKEISVMARSDSTMSSWVKEYMRTFDIEHPDEIGAEGFVHEEYEAIANKLATSATINSYILSMTFGLPSTFKGEKHNDFWRLANVIEAEYKGLVKMFNPVGLIVQRQMNLVELRNEILRALDPVTAGERSRGRGFLSDENISAGLSKIEESYSTVTVDDTVHQTFWISEWPRVDVEPGFLSAFSDRGDFTRCLTLQYRPIEMGRAMKKIRRDRTSYLNTVDIYEKMGQVIPYQLEQQHQDLLEREEELVSGAGVFQFRGFLTISAESKEALEDAALIVKTAAAMAHTEVKARQGQQLACLVQTVLPFGVL